MYVLHKNVKKINLPASARCMIKKFIRFLRALLNDKATSTAPLPSTIDKNNIHKTVNCMVCKNNKKQNYNNYKYIHYCI